MLYSRTNKHRDTHLRQMVRRGRLMDLAAKLDAEAQAEEEESKREYETTHSVAARDGRHTMAKSGRKVSVSAARAAASSCDPRFPI